jgi:hypothetical protein
MAYVSAGNAIRGNITSWHEGDDAFQVTNIGRIIVGPSLNAAGIFGDIESKRAGIDAIFTTGPIGTVTSPTKIWAADGIDYIRARAEDSVGDPLDRDINASIRSNLDWQPFPSDIGGPMPRSDGQIFLIETAGDLTGEVRAANISYPVQGTTNLVHSGILVRGDILAPITIDLNLENADIIGRNILAPIVIGVKAKGAIVATDTLGVIDSVEVGYTSAAEPAVLAAYRAVFPSAFCGNDCPPINDVDPITGLRIPGPWFGSNPRCVNIGGLDYGTVDSVIRADKIGSIDIRAMTVVYYFSDGAGVLRKSFAPRIEATTIDSIAIEDFREGVVWSGRLEYDPQTGQVDNDPSNDYATTITPAQLRCVGPGADLWLTGTVDLQVGQTMLGEAYFDELGRDSSVRIGKWLGGLNVNTGLIVGDCTCDPLVIPLAVRSPPAYSCDGYYSADSGFENSPRSPGRTEMGRVVITEASGLVGQVLVNAANGSFSSGSYWFGEVQVESAPTDTLLSPRVAQPNQAPYYETLSSEVGLGAVGLVPFNLHDTDCLPPNGTKGICEVDPYPPNNNKRTVVLRHYGPISEVAGSTPAIVIERQDWALTCPHPSTCYLVPVWNDVTSCFNVSVAPTSSIAPSNVSGEREIWVWPKTQVTTPCLDGTWSNRTYRIRPRLSTTGDATTTRVRSDQTLVTVDPPVVYWDYVFSLECFDLNMNGIPDMNDVPVFLSQHADYNEDEVVDTQDLSLLVQAIVNGGE